MKYILILLLIGSQHAMGQLWHNAKDTLKLPKSPGNIYNASGSLKEYDTVSIRYILNNDSVIHKGYKMVLISHGFYIDNSHTFGVFFDAKRHRIKDINGYGFDDLDPREN